jgi:hypothetical protein
MRTFAICAVISLAFTGLPGVIASPAFSQEDPLQSDDTSLQKRLDKLEQADRQHRQDAADVDKAYQRTIKSQHSDAPAAKVDPWGNIRASDPQSKTSK